ncbi:GNAT family N-acetyltransferase [bacterium]|nr:MAG: GNAT family N-acetyltransferase [bacterium]
MEIRVLDSKDLEVLDRVADELFDRPIRRCHAAEFLADPRHHLAVAIEDGTVVGFASGVHYVHPDQPAALWVNEIAVATSHRRRGAARRLLDAIFERARSIGCRGAWVGTAVDNAAARALYDSAGGRRASPEFVMYEWDFECGR